MQSAEVASFHFSGFRLSCEGFETVRLKRLKSVVTVVKSKLISKTLKDAIFNEIAQFQAFLS